MIIWLRRLMRTHALIGIPLAATYLFFLSCRGRRFRELGIVAFVLVVLAALVVPRYSTHCDEPAPGAYTLTDLGALPGGNGESWAAGINDLGQVVGGSGAKSGQTHAVLWQNGSLKDLGAVSGGSSYASHISNEGLIVGSIADAKHATHAVLWRRGNLEALDLPGAVSAAVGVNDAGQITGTMGTGDPEDNNAFLWRNGSHTAAGHFIARGINPDGEIAGIEQDPRSFTAVIYQQGTKRRLSTPEYEESGAYAINANGLVAGYCGKWMHEEAALWDHGQLRRLGKLGGAGATALALNDRDQIVGTSTTASGENHAFVWQGNRMQDLNDLLPPRSDWVLTRATGINARGQIVGSGKIAGLRHAFLLTPTER
jgi:probable HAF family extracellular repeat protein